MAFFGKFKSASAKVFGAAKKLFGSKTAPKSTDARDVATSTEAQAARRKRLLEIRVENRERARQGKPLHAESGPYAGESQKIYKDKKGTSAGESPELQDFLNGHTFSRFASSNVAALCYDPIRKFLHVQFLRRKRANVWYTKTTYSCPEKALRCAAHAISKPTSSAANAATKAPHLKGSKSKARLNTAKPVSLAGLPNAGIAKRCAVAETL